MRLLDLSEDASYFPQLLLSKFQEVKWINMTFLKVGTDDWDFIVSTWKQNSFNKIITHAGD